MVYLTRRYRFSASHRLHSNQLSQDENWSVYGKCNNDYGHGHNYYLEVTVAGPVDAVTGRVADPADLDGLHLQAEPIEYGRANLAPQIRDPCPVCIYGINA